MEPATKQRGRHHLHESVLQPAVRFAPELLGHRDVRTTMIYTHVLNRGGRGVLSPADRLGLVRPRGKGTTPAALPPRNSDEPEN